MSFLACLSRKFAVTMLRFRVATKSKGGMNGEVKVKKEENDVMAAMQRDGPTMCWHCRKTGHVKAFCKEKPLWGPGSDKANAAFIAIGIDSGDEFLTEVGFGWWRLRGCTHFFLFCFISLLLAMCWVWGGVLEFRKLFGANYSTLVSTECACDICKYPISIFSVIFSY